MKTYLFFLFGAALLLGSCQTKLHPQKESKARYSEFSDMGGDDLERKIIYDASMKLAVKNPDSAIADVKRIAKKYSGYTQEIQSTQTTIRVKHTQLNEAMADLMALGKVEWKRIKGDDVTDSYKDYKIRLDNAEKTRARYIELLNKAVTVEEIIKVEKELERLNETIDLMKGKINRIDHLSEFSTITVYIDEKPKPGIVGYVFVGLYKGVKWLFIRN